MASGEFPHSLGSTASSPVSLRRRIPTQIRSSDNAAYDTILAVSLPRSGTPAGYHNIRREQFYDGTPLHIAVQYYRAGVARMLISEGADVEKRAPDDLGYHVDSRCCTQGQHRYRHAALGCRGPAVQPVSPAAYCAAGGCSQGMSLPAFFVMCCLAGLN